jgi:tRNA-specific adenosine deaminase 2
MITLVTRNGTKHAEIVAIDDALIKQKLNPHIFSKCDLYVTCEPCIMCAAALARIRIRHVYFGCSNERFGGNGSILSIHKNSNGSEIYGITPDVMKEEAIEIFQRFYLSENRRAPEAKRKRKRGGWNDKTKGTDIDIDIDINVHQSDSSLQKT